MPVLSEGRNTWQRVWETKVNSTVQNDPETITKDYVTDYTSVANRDIFVYEHGSYTQKYVYGINGDRLWAEFDYAEETKPGEPGENLASDFASVDIQKIWYRRNLTESTLFAVDENDEVINHVMYDDWGKPLTDLPLNQNYAGIDNINNYAGYTNDEVLELYFVQNRFYNAETRQFTQEDPIKDGANWYAYCEGNPLVYVDWYGLDNGRTRYTKTGAKLRVDGIGKKTSYYSLDPNTTVWRTYHDNGEWIGVSVLGTGQTGQIKALMLKLEKSQGSAPAQTGRTASTRSSASMSTKTTKPADSVQIAAGTKKAPQNPPSASTIKILPILVYTFSQECSTLCYLL